MGGKKGRTTIFFLLNRLCKASEILKCYKVTIAVIFLFICYIRSFFPKIQGILEQMKSRMRERNKLNNFFHNSPCDLTITSSHVWKDGIRARKRKKKVKILGFGLV